jgi:tripartite-type tricarboxylate transporter receptor subunit TctC
MKISLSRALAAVAVAVLIDAQSVKTASAEDWPARAVTLVVPFAAGGGTDVMARIIAGPMSSRGPCRTATRFFSVAVPQRST